MADDLFNQRLADYFAEQDRVRAARSALVVTAEPPVPAIDEAARLSRALAVPPHVVASAPEFFRAEEERRRLQRQLQDAPITARWMMERENGALARDDVEALSWFERNTGALGRAVGRGVRSTPAIPEVGAASVRAQILGDIGRSSEQIFEDEVAALGPNPLPEMIATARLNAQARYEAANGMSEREITRMLSEGAQALQRAESIRESVRAIPMSAGATRFRDATLPAAPNTIAGVFGAIAKDPLGALAFTAEMAAEALPVLAASAAVTAATRSPATGVAAMTGSSFLLEASASAMEFLEEKGVDLSTPEAAAAVLQDEALMREAADRGLTRGLVIALFDAVSGGVAGQALARSPVGDAVAQAVAQATLGSTGELAAQAASGQDTDWANVVFEGLAEAVTAPVEVGGVAGRAFLGDAGRAARAGETAGLLDQVDAQAAASRLRERDPDRFQSLLDEQGLGDQAVYVPAEGLREFFQAKDVLEEEALTAWGIDPATFEEAVAAGRDVSVPLSVYAARIAGTEDARWFRENGSMSEDEMSLAAAERFEAEVRDALDKAVEEAERQWRYEQETRASDMQVYDTVYGQLREAGRTPDVASNEARVWQAFWRTMGERYGEDPLELAQSMGVRIVGPQTPERARQRGGLDIALNTLRRQGAKALRPRGPSLVEWIASMGGLRDTGGDVEAMEPPKGVIAETRAEALARQSQPSLDGTPAGGKGRGLDEMGRAAIEAGFFPDLTGRDDVDEAAVLLEALTRELRGQPVYRPGDEPDPDLSALAEDLSRRAIDLADVDNDAAVAALDRDEQGREFGQEKQAVQAVAARFDLPPDVVQDIISTPVDVLRERDHYTAPSNTDTPTEDFPRLPLGTAKIGRYGDPGEAYVEFLREFDPKDLVPSEPEDGIRQSKTYQAYVQWFREGREAPPIDVVESARGDRVPVSLSRRRTLAAQEAGVERIVGWYSPENHEKGIPLKYKDVLNAYQDAAGTFDPADPRILFQPAYHGTPNAGFDRFSTAHIGEGEGAQAFGWGLYFAGRKEIAQHYRETLSALRINTPDGQSFNVETVGGFDEFRDWLDEQSKTAPELPTIKGESFTRRTYADMFDEAWSEVDTDRPIGETLADIAAWLRDEAEDKGERYRGIGEARGTPEVVTRQYRMAADWVDSLAASGALTTPEGRLFKVDVPEDSELLDWDKPLSAQPDEVRAKLAEVIDLYKSMHPRSNALDGDMRVSQIYQLLSGPTYAGSPEVVSRDLRAVGIPGHRYLDGTSRGVGEGSYNYVIYDDSRVKVLEFEQEKRGSIVFPAGGPESGQTVINLFESADLSTFLHESGHFFLEAFATLASKDGAPEAMKADLAAVRDWLGAKEGEPFTTAQHEQWARGFEAYALEGKAPSLELADAFARFKAWLTRIYRSLRGLNVKLSPEVREVMDRMLATDAEIAAAREGQRMSPLFTDQTAAGMAEGSWRIYQRMARRSAEEAAQALLAKTMAKVRREREAWWKEERAKVREEIASTVNSRREFRLTELMANGRWIGSDKPVPDMQLDRDELVETFGEGVLAELSRTKFGGKRAIYAKGGMSLREAAEFFGFASPDEMVKVLQNAGRRRDALEAETDRVMSDRYGDPLNDGSIEEEALAAIHSEQQAQTVAMEARHLAQRAGQPTRDLNARVFRQRARLMLGRMTVREAIRPDAFLAAGRQAAKRAEDAFARVAAGDSAALGVAARHKEQQLLNHYLYLEARDAKVLVDKQREAMRAYGKKSVRAKLAGGYIEQIDAILEDYDFRVRSQRQVQRAESLRAFVARMEAEGRAGEIAIDERLMDEAKRRHYTALSLDELRGLFDTIANIDHLGRFKKKLQDARDARNLDAVVGEVLGAFRANVKPRPPERIATPGERRRETVRQFLNTTLNADTLLREIDGFADLGPAWRHIKAPIDAAMGRLIDRRREMAERFDAIYGVYSAKEKREMAKKRHVPALGGAYSKWDLLALALNTGNVDNFERLTNKDAPGHFQPEAVEAALAGLDERDWRTVQAIWDYIDSFWPEIAAKEKRQTGTEPKKVAAKVMVTAAPGFVTGGYYPIRYDNRLSGMVEDYQQKDIAEELLGGRFGKAQTRNGHTKERKATTKLPVLLDLSVAHSHVDQVLHDLEVGEPVVAAWKVLHDQRIREAFTQSGKRADFDALEVWLQDVAAGERIAAGGLQTFLRHLRSGFTISRLALNLSTVLIQPSGLAQSAVVVGKEAMLRGFVDYAAHRGRWVREATAASPFMRERQLTFERDIYNVVGDLEGGPVTGRWERFQRNVMLPLSFVLMQKVQFHVVDMPTWVAAYQKEIGRSGDEAKARTYADHMVRRAQGSGLLSDRGALERGTLNRNSRQQELPRMLTALGSYMFAKGNVAYERARRTDFKNPVEVMKLAADMALLFTFEAALYALVKGGLPDEDEPEEWAKWLLWETAMSAMGTFPVLREMSGSLDGFGGGGIFGAAVETLMRPAVQAGQGEVDKALVKSIVDAGGVLLHLPSSQAKAVIDGFLEDDLSLRDDGSPLDALGLGTQGRSLAEMMFAD